MTAVYFVRHAEPNYNNYDDKSRELSQKGLRDRVFVTEFLEDKDIHMVLSSPFKRALDTVEDFSSKYGHQIQIIEEFQERKVDSGWIENFNEFCKNQWNDFSYKRKGGESLAEVQQRNIAALKKVIHQYENKNIVVGSHGTALSTIINYYDITFGYEEFNDIKHKMPWIVELTVQGDKFLEWKSYDLPCNS